MGPIQLSTYSECKILSEIFLYIENSGWPNPLVYTYNYVAGNLAYIRQGTNSIEKPWDGTWANEPHLKIPKNVCNSILYAWIR